MSRFRTNFAFSSMNLRRGSTSSPINVSNSCDASNASSMVTLRSVRRAGSIVVLRSWSGFISPRPLALNHDVPVAAFAVRESLHVGVPLLFFVGVELFLALGDPVQRRLRDIDVPRIDQELHFLVEEREEQGADVRAVHVGVRHDDDLVIARVVDLEVLTYARADRGNDGPDFLVGQDLVDPRLLHVEDLASQREDRLEAAVPTLLG